MGNCRGFQKLKHLASDQSPVEHHRDPGSVSSALVDYLVDSLRKAAPSDWAVTARNLLSETAWYRRLVGEVDIVNRAVHTMCPTYLDTTVTDRVEKWLTSTVTVAPVYGDESDSENRQRAFKLIPSWLHGLGAPVPSLPPTGSPAVGLDPGPG